MSAAAILVINSFSSRVDTGTVLDPGKFKAKKVKLKAKLKVKLKTKAKLKTKPDVKGTAVYFRIEKEK